MSQGLIEKHFDSRVDNYLKPKGRLVLGLSGGVDSRVLLHLMARYRSLHPEVECIAVHVHHGLSSYADEWVEKCRKWCRDYRIEIVVKRVQLNLANQISTEQEAREKRYQAFRTEVHHGDLLLSAQHSGDQLETFLLALKRGSGPKGLSAMPECAPFADGLLVRPLLNISREVIVEYAHQMQLEWVEDESNLDTQYDRNFLRHRVIPELKSRWPAIENSVLRSSKLCAEQEQLLNELLQDRLNTMTDESDGLDIYTLKQQSLAARNQLLWLWLQKQNCLMPSLKQLTLIWDEVALAKQDANPKINLTSGEVRRYQNRLFFLGKMSDVSQWSASLADGLRIVLPDNLGSIRVIEKCLASPLSLRNPIDGEKIWVHFNAQGLIAHPTERGHSRKLKKLFQEYGVPSWLRTRTPLIMYDNKLAMVAGLFVCKEFYGEDCEIQWDKV